MTRKNFIGGLIAATALPGCQTNEPSIFSQRGKFERLLTVGIHVKAGATQPFSILHISDTHFTEAYAHESEDKQELKRVRTQTFGGHQEEALRDSLDWAKRNVDYVLHTGDLIDFQSEANFDLVRKYFGDIAMGTMGNHEFSPSMWLTKDEVTYDDAWRAKSIAKLTAAYPFDLSFVSKVVNGVNFVMLDDVFGTVSESQVERFMAEAKKGLPIVLCMHVPIYTDNIWRIDHRFWVNQDKKFRQAVVPPLTGDFKRQRNDKVTSDFLAYLKQERLLKAILVGHAHLVMQDRFSPTAMEYVVGGNFLFHGQEVLFT